VSLSLCVLARGWSRVGRDAPISVVGVSMHAIWSRRLRDRGSEAATQLATHTLRAPLGAPTTHRAAQARTQARATGETYYYDSHNVPSQPVALRV